MKCGRLTPSRSIIAFERTESDLVDFSNDKPSSIFRKQTRTQSLFTCFGGEKNGNSGGLKRAECHGKGRRKNNDDVYYFVQGDP